MAGYCFLRHTRQEVEDIVSRLRRDTVASTRQDGTSEELSIQEKQKSNPKYLGLRKVNQEELDEITQRLCRPNKMSLIRQKRPQHIAPMPEVS